MELTATGIVPDLHRLPFSFSNQIEKPKINGKVYLHIHPEKYCYSRGVENKYFAFSISTALCRKCNKKKCIILGSEHIGPQHLKTLTINWH